MEKKNLFLLILRGGKMNKDKNFHKNEEQKHRKEKIDEEKFEKKKQQLIEEMEKKNNAYLIDCIDVWLRYKTEFEQTSIYKRDIAPFIKTERGKDDIDKKVSYIQVLNGIDPRMTISFTGNLHADRLKEVINNIALSPQTYHGFIAYVVNEKSPVHSFLDKGIYIYPQPFLKLTNAAPVPPPKNKSKILKPDKRIIVPSFARTTKAG